MQRDIRSPRLGSIRMCLQSEPVGQDRIARRKICHQQRLKINDQYAAPTGTCLRKGAQDEWRTGKNVSENPTIIIRYADVLLMYAEAKIELGELDASMLNAINDVRARAYKTTRDNTAAYPALALSDQNTMRLAVRKERRVEFAWEGRRFFDLLRWDGWMEKAFSHDYYAFPTKQGMVDMEKSRRLLLALNSGD